MKSLLLPGLALVLAMALAAGNGYATPTNPANLQLLSSGGRTLPSESNGTIAAQGGNVTQVNIDALTITKSWQGYYGNVTGNIRLDDANNNSFYVWGNTTAAGEVYATRISSVDWTNVNCTNSTNVTSEETYLGQTAADGDSVTNTFNSTTHPQFIVGTETIYTDTCFSTNVNVNGSQQSTQFHQIMLSDDSANLVYTTIIENAEYAYNSQTADFQLLVGENEKVGNEGPTTYYFFVELS